MLLRASTWHRFCLTHPLRHPYPDLQCLTIFRSFSRSFEEESRPDSPRVASSSQSSSEAARIPHDEKATVSDKTTTIHSSRPSNGIRNRPRSLRPLLIPPTFPQSIIPETPNSDPQHSSCIQKDIGEIGSSVTITLANLPPNTFKSDIRPVFQQFGEIQRVVVGPDGTRADIIFMDAQGAKRTLHAYAEEPFFVRGREIVVFRKCVGIRAVNDHQANTTTNASRARQDWGDGSGVIFVSQFPSGTTQDELSEAFSRFGRYERFVMRPGSRYAYVVYSSDDLVDQILRSHKRIPVTVQGESLRIERTVNRPYTLSPASSDIALELGNSLDPPASKAIIKELKQTVPRWRGSYEPSRVLWIGRLPTNMSREALTNFWSRLGCVVEVRASTSGFAHVEFSSTEEALRAARKGAPHGFRYADRLLDVDFAPWLFYIGPFYRVVYISGWPASHTRPELLQWAYDIPHVAGGAVLPPFRGEERTVPRTAFLYFRSIDDARAGLHRLEGRSGPRGEALRVSLSCFPALPLKSLWDWMYAEEEKRLRGEEAHFEREWEGLGFGTGASAEEPGPNPNVSPVGTRGGRVRLRNTTRAGVALTGVFADGSLEGGAWDDEVLEEAMQTAMEDARRAVSDDRQGQP